MRTFSVVGGQAYRTCGGKCASVFRVEAGDGRVANEIYGKRGRNSPGFEPTETADRKYDLNPQSVFFWQE
jgi:hypothetical protein